MTFADGGLDEVVARRGLDVLVVFELVLIAAVEQGRVAQVVRHHDGRVQRRKVQRGDGLAVVTAHRFDDGGAFVIVAHFRLVHRHQQTLFSTLQTSINPPLFHYLPLLLNSLH